VAAGILDHNIGVVAVTICPIDLDKTAGLTTDRAFHIGQFFVVRFNFDPAIRVIENYLLDKEPFDLRFQVGMGAFVEQSRFRVIAESAVYIPERVGL